MGGRWLAVMLLSTAVAANGQEASMPAATAPAKHADQSWIARSNEYANLLVDIEKQHSPEDASGDGFSQYDELISQPTQQDEEAEVAETEAVLAKLKVQLGIEKDKYLKQDLAIIIRSVGLALRRQKYSEDHLVSTRNASGYVFRGLRTLLDDQVVPGRRKAARGRLRKYAGLEPGFNAITELLKQRVQLQMAKPNVVYPSKLSVETGLSRNSLYVKGIASHRYSNNTGWRDGRMRTPR